MEKIGKKLIICLLIVSAVYNSNVYANETIEKLQQREIITNGKDFFETKEKYINIYNDLKNIDCKIENNFEKCYELTDNLLRVSRNHLNKLLFALSSKYENDINLKKDSKDFWQIIDSLCSPLALRNKFLHHSRNEKYTERMFEYEVWDCRKDNIKILKESPFDEDIEKYNKESFIIDDAIRIAQSYRDGVFTKKEYLTELKNIGKANSKGKKHINISDIVDRNNVNKSEKLPSMQDEINKQLKQDMADRINRDLGRIANELEYQSWQNRSSKK